MNSGDVLSIAEYDAYASDEYKPVNTAIYIPNDHRVLAAGGAAIYMRQRDFDTLILEAFGLKNDSIIDDIYDDIALLHIIDDIPSLDPFLLRTEITSAGYKMPDTAFLATDKENSLIRSRIESKVEPILYRAVKDFESSGVLDQNKIQKFLKVIWNPDVPEAEIFIRSFGIEPSQTKAIFTAWKGITFYQIQFEKIAHSLKKIFMYLRDKNLKPIDARFYSAMDIEMLNAKVANVYGRLRDIVEQCRKIFTNYDLAYSEFVGSNNPVTFKNFMMEAHRNYWTLGYSIVACKNAYERINKKVSMDKPTSLRFDAMSSMCDEINVLLTRDKRDMRKEPLLDLSELH
ncbi:MAG: hypothetical protein KJ904_12420 [Alphaproteobacteria bacterium]|nr:hypothetical protein [Alphaproteobacteria bacterium]MBU0799335.1 hypothetical protein [Alphaproteobacteria bacterium]MBU0887957.1 hypothetical protein [Alphaproteobacteria bacterium]MBU1814820.1 hypothetical protein [Alphaproteobacteria bacterium]MBU2090875.1 hypothetical protein [Alphaproteobacteria bacterium]